MSTLFWQARILICVSKYYSILLNLLSLLIIAIVYFVVSYSRSVFWFLCLFNSGEMVAEATRMEMQRNDYDTTNASGRKIDLLLKLDEENVELCSNEWKSENTKYLKIRQQSKNIRTNCAILNSLHIMSKGSIKELMALDMIGKVE